MNGACFGVYSADGGGGDAGAPFREEEKPSGNGLRLMQVPCCFSRQQYCAAGKRKPARNVRRKAMSTRGTNCCLLRVQAFGFVMRLRRRRQGQNIITTRFGRAALLPTRLSTTR